MELPPRQDPPNIVFPNVHRRELGGLARGDERRQGRDVRLRVWGEEVGERVPALTGFVRDAVHGRDEPAVRELLDEVARVAREERAGDGGRGDPVACGMNLKIKGWASRDGENITYR